jgi:hypothetical protein
MKNRTHQGEATHERGRVKKEVKVNMLDVLSTQG